MPENSTNLTEGGHSPSMAKNEMRTHSPCIAICDTLYRDICSGCGRTVKEVYEWIQMTDEEKEAVWVRIEEQASAYRYTTYKERANGR